MLIAFTVQSWLAVGGKSPTADEPLGAVAAYLQTFDRDFRINPEDPPLVKYWASIPHRAGELLADRNESRWRADPDAAGGGFIIASRWLFQTPGNDGVAFINASRRFMLAFGVALGAAIVAWTWQIAGASAALLACAFFSFDPNFLAHAPLLKNDVAIALVMVCFAWAVWSVGRAAHWWNCGLLAAALAAALVVKFSGLLLIPVLLILLGLRVLIRQPWECFGVQLARWWQRMLAAAGVMSACGLFCWVAVWASYGFRFAPSPVPGTSLPLNVQIRQAADNRFFATYGRHPTEAERAALPIPKLARLAQLAGDHHLLPQAWLYGLVYTYQSSLVRSAYLMGETSLTGWWYYFPLTMLFKTPVSTLLALAMTAGAAVRLRRSRPLSHTSRWTLLCLLTPPLLYFATALATNLNLGVRHCLPVYPFLYAGVGCVAALLGRRALMIAAALVIGLVIESASSFPDYLSYFNFPSRPHRLYLLGDSNLDWGQDLPALARWLRERRPARVFLGYWGPVDPRFYGIEYENLPGGFAIDHSPPPATAGAGPAVMAVSASLLQQAKVNPGWAEIYQRLLDRPPDRILGGSIYLYELPPP